jgi:phosphohistidine phosphatase SixA
MCARGVKDVSCAMLVGHNPGFEECVHLLGGDPDLLMKTCTVAIFECADGWNKAGAETCRLVRVMRAELGAGE